MGTSATAATASRIRTWSSSLTVPHVIVPAGMAGESLGGHIAAEAFSRWISVMGQILGATGPMTIGTMRDAMGAAALSDAMRTALTMTPADWLASQPNVAVDAAGNEQPAQPAPVRKGDWLKLITIGRLAMGGNSGPLARAICVP